MNYNINNVEAMWPRINRTYKYDTVEQRSVPCSPTDEGSAYTLQFRMTEEQAKALYKHMKLAYDSKKEANWPPKFNMPFKKDEDGSYTHKAKLKVPMIMNLQENLHIMTQKVPSYPKILC